MVGRDETPVTRINASIRSPSNIGTLCHSQLGFYPISIIFAAIGSQMDMHTTHYNSYVTSVFTQIYQASQPNKSSPGWGGACLLCACQRRLWDWAATLRTSAQAEAAVGVAPLRPTPALLPFEGLWVCCETAAPGGGLEFSSFVHHSTLGFGGERGGGGRATVASAVGPPGVRTPGSGRVEHNLHPAAPPPRLHECADREPRPSVGVAPCAGLPVLRGWLGRLRGGRHRVPHGVHPWDEG